MPAFSRALWRTHAAGRYYRETLRTVTLTYIDNEYGPLYLSNYSTLWRTRPDMQPLPPKRLPNNMLVAFTKVRDDTHRDNVSFELYTSYAASFIGSDGVESVEIASRIRDAEAAFITQLNDEQRHAFHALWKAKAYKGAYEYVRIASKFA